MVANAASLASGAAIVVASLLPTKVLRLFPRSVLEAISALAVRTLAIFDPTGKSTIEILDAVKKGRITREDAIAHVAGLGAAVDDTHENASGQFRKIEFALKALEATKKPLSDASSSVEGAMLFVLFKLSTAFCGKQKGTVSFDYESADGTSASIASTKSFSAQLVRPTSESQMSALLNMFIAVCHSTGLANVLALTAMLEDVIYEPTRSGVIAWPVAFECLVVYLRMLEAQGAVKRYNVSDIYLKAGGIDAVRAEATHTAKALYPAVFFRTHGGTPSDTTRPTVGDPNKDEKFKGTVKGDSSSCKAGCVAWNKGLSHFAKHINGDGTCKFKHACNQWVTDKGPRGQCLGAHTVDKCDYDKDKRCMEAVKA